jgi:transcription antitermination factor NusG
LSETPGPVIGVGTGAEEDLQRSSWQAVYTRHQHEKLAARNLERKGFEVFLPLYSDVRQWRDRRKKLHLPVFPCYIFLRGVLERRLDVLTTPGVHSVVGNAGRAALIPAEEIAAIRRLVESRADIEPCPYLPFGCRVTVKSGPLRGLEGILTRRKEGSSRLVLSIELLRRSVAVEVDENLVERAGDDSRPKEHGTPPCWSPLVVV